MGGKVSGGTMEAEAKAESLSPAMRRSDQGTRQTLKSSEICAHCKLQGHNSTGCWFLNPSLRPSWWRDHNGGDRANPKGESKWRDDISDGSRKSNSKWKDHSRGDYSEGENRLAPTRDERRESHGCSENEETRKGEKKEESMKCCFD